MPISPTPSTLVKPLVDGNLEEGLPLFEFSYTGSNTGSKTDCADTSECVLGVALLSFAAPHVFGCVS